MLDGTPPRRCEPSVRPKSDSPFRDSERALSAPVASLTTRSRSLRPGGGYQARVAGHDNPAPGSVTGRDTDPPAGTTDEVTVAGRCSIRYGRWSSQPGMKVPKGRAGSTACVTAAQASRTPAPDSDRSRSRIGAAVWTRIRLMSRGVSAGLACSMSATTPATCGAENDVPEPTE